MKMLLSKPPISVIFALLVMLFLFAIPTAVLCVVVEENAYPTYVTFGKQAVVPVKSPDIHHPPQIFAIGQKAQTTAVAGFFLADTAILLISYIFTLPLGSLILVRQNWARFVYAAFALLALPIAVYAALMINFLLLLYSLTSITTVILLFVPSSNLWFRRA